MACVFSLCLSFCCGNTTSIRSVSSLKRNGNLLGLFLAVKLRTLALGHNIWRKFFYKPNECMVAFFYEGNPAIFKNGVPHVRMYTCYEDEKGDRRGVEYGKLRGIHLG